MEIRRQQQPDGNQPQRSLRESQERAVKNSSDGVRSAREERAEFSKGEQAKAARLGQANQPREARKPGADSVQISEQARRLSEAETERPDAQSELDKGIAKHLRKLGIREDMIAKDKDKGGVKQEGVNQGSDVKQGDVKQGGVKQGGVNQGSDVKPSQDELDKGIAKHLRKQAIDQDKGIAKHNRKLGIREDMIAKDKEDAGPGERAAGLRSETNTAMDRIQGLRVKNQRMGLAAEARRDANQTERLVDFRRLSEAGSLNSPERIGRAADRMLGDDS